MEFEFKPEYIPMTSEEKPLKCGDFLESLDLFGVVVAFDVEDKAAFNCWNYKTSHKGLIRTELGRLDIVCSNEQLTDTMDALNCLYSIYRTLDSSTRHAKQTYLNALTKVHKNKLPMGKHLGFRLLTTF